MMSELSRDEKRFWEGPGVREVARVLCEIAGRLGRGEAGVKSGVGAVGLPKKQKKERTRTGGGTSSTTG